MPNKLNIRKIIFIAISLVLLIGVLQWLWHYTHTGTIVVTTNNKYNTIILTNVNNGVVSSSQPYKAHGKLSVSVGVGQYLASVSGNSLATTQLINLGSRKTLHYEIDPINTTGVEPVAYVNAQNLVASDSELLFLNVNENDHNLYKIDSQNNSSLINLKQQFQSVGWANTSFGAGQSSNGNLYLIANDSLSSIRLPFYYANNNVNFDVSSNKNIYVSNGADVYERSQDGKFKKIYSSTYNDLILGAGSNRVAVANQTEGQGSNTPTPLLAVVNPSSGDVAKKAIDSGTLAWSSNGQYLASSNGSTVDVYDSSLNQIATTSLSTRNVYIKWLNNNSFFYSSNDQLWSYDLASQRANLVANMPLGDNITSLTISSDKAYIYVTTIDSSGNNPAIRRVGLKGQKVLDVVYQLQDILPMNLSNVTVSLINFTEPTIQVEPFPNNGLSPDASVQVAQSALAQDGIDLSKLKFVFTQGN